MPTDMLRNASVDEITRALVEASVDRKGLAFEVGMALFEQDVSKEFPGQDPDDINPKSPDSGEVCVLSYDPARREEAGQAYRDIWNHPVPSYDPNDPKWLKATRAERRAARNAAELWAKHPEVDPVPRFLASLDQARNGSWAMSWTRPSFQSGAPKSRAEAEAEVARWATYGVVAEVRGYEPTPTSHCKSLKQYLCRGPIG